MGEKLAVPRISDLPYIHSSTRGKIELEGLEEVKEDQLIDGLTKKAVFNIFRRYYKLEKLEEIVAQFSGGFSIEVSDTMSVKFYMHHVKTVTGLASAVKVVNSSESPEVIASAVEFILEGLHVHNRLNKVEIQGKMVYRR